MRALARGLRRLVLLAVLFAGTLGAPAAAWACSHGGCVSAGPRLASVSSARGVLLNALLATLGGGNVTLSALDWNAIATGDLSLARTLSALQGTLSLSTPAQALNANATVAQIVGAAASAAQQEGKTALAASLLALQPQLALPTPIRLGDLLVSDGVLGTTRINALAVVMGTVQLYNRQNVATTPAPIAISGASLGLAGVLNSVTLQAQVVEPPVYVCGPLGSTFHSAAIRVKLHLDLVSIALNLGVLNTSASVGQLDLYLEVARASGVLAAVDAIAQSLTVQAAPGVAATYLGSIADAVFFNRSHAIVAGDLAPGNIGSLSLLGTTVAIMAKSTAIGSAPSTTTLSFTGPGLQTQTAYTSANFAANLYASLIENVQLSLSPGGLLDHLLATLKPVLVAAVKPVLTTVLTGVIDPLLELLGIRVGEVDVTSGGSVLVCSVSGSVYQDANHSGQQDAGEAGTGATLYAKLVAAATPASASAVVAVDATTGSYQFTGVLPASYTVVVSTDGSAAAVSAVAPGGWVATEAPTLVRAAVVSTANLSGLRFGLYHGSRLAGRVFVDDGAGGGTAHDGLRNGGEAAVAATVLQLTDASGATVHDRTRSDSDGSYVLWAPFATQGASLRVLQPADAVNWVSVSGRAGTTGGSYVLATDSVGFTHASGSSYSGVDFGDVAANRLESDGQRTVAPGSTVIYPHRFVSGSAGQLTLGATALGTVPDGFSATVFVDAACNGQLDAADTPVSGALALVAGDQTCLLVKVFVPATAAAGARVPVTLAASFAYANLALVRSAERQDVTTVGGANGLRLVKTVDRSAANSGDLIVYTISFVNDGSSAIDTLRIRDAAPAWTAFESAACGSLPAGVSCSVTLAPAAGGVEWTLTGNVLAGASGTVTFTVRLQ